MPEAARLPEIEGSRLERWRETLHTLASRPPQVILLEGGTEAIRLQMALYWAMSVNCPASPPPCMQCPTCKQIAANQNLDISIYDGRISNTQDIEKPGPIKALRMENIRELKAGIFTRPHGGGKKIAIFQGMGATREEAMNSLLKMLEEPGENVLFVLLTPQRSQILQTLVSRSFCITLPWTDSTHKNPDILQWESSLASFFNSSGDFLDKISARGALDATLAGQLILSCQRAIVRVIGNMAEDNHESFALDKVFAPVADKPEAVGRAIRWLDEAQKMIQATASPARVLEALCTKLYLLMRKQG